MHITHSRPFLRFVVAVLCTALPSSSSTVCPPAPPPPPDPDFGNCPNPGITYGYGVDGSSYYDFEPSNQTQFPYGFSHDIASIESYICNRLEHHCDATQKGVQKCDNAFRAYSGLSGRNAADKWNAALGLPDLPGSTASCTDGTTVTITETETQVPAPGPSLRTTSSSISGLTTYAIAITSELSTSYSNQSPTSTTESAAWTVSVTSETPIPFTSTTLPIVQITKASILSTASTPVETIASLITVTNPTSVSIVSFSAASTSTEIISSPSSAATITSPSMVPAPTLTEAGSSPAANTDGSPFASFNGAGALRHDSRATWSVGVVISVCCVCVLI